MADLQRHAELFPIPAPYPWTIQICHGGSRKKRQRFRRRRALELLTNLQMEGARPRAAETGAVPVPTVAAKVAFPDALHGDSGEEIKRVPCMPPDAVSLQVRDELKALGHRWDKASHEELLRAHEALRAEEELRFGVIPPRAPLGHYTGVCIDDKLSMQLIPKSKPEMPLRDHDACANAAAAYDHAGLVVHEKKQVRRAEVFCAWGAEVEGVHGYCGAKRSRLAWLAVLTFKASRSRVLTRKLLDELVGCWAFCLQFRRPLFSLIELMYNEGPVSKGFRPSQALRAEMQVLALLGMTAMSQLRTQVGPTMYATDASPDGAGAVSSTVEPGLAREIARRAECRGFHTRLLPPISAHLHEKGFVVDESLISSDFDLGHTQPPLDAGDPAPLLHKTAMFPVTSKIASMHDLADRMRQASARPQKGIGARELFAIPKSDGLWSSDDSLQHPQDLAGWIQTVQPDLPGLSQLARNQPVILSELVEEFGRTLYEQGASRRTFAETVNALQQKFAFLKTWLHGSWALLTTWESLWPGQDHPPMPLMLLKAMVSTALAWGWKRVSLLLLVGFYGLLRPVEACLMKVTDFMTPADTGVPDILILQLHHVKSRTRGAKFQSVRLEEPHVITFIKKCFASMSQDERHAECSVCNLAEAVGLEPPHQLLGKDSPSNFFVEQALHTADLPASPHMQEAFPAGLKAAQWPHLGS
ncbi:unnamed protein product [Cladocopium goreaui]|uniref:Actin n=1 Tax=Cladocopium goreaui TaxID=2562237 RepID=A0A9P1CUB2_9DINO|nr:unnamed protein product [Cladocopium goreaui]